MLVLLGIPCDAQEFQLHGLVGAGNFVSRVKALNDGAFVLSGSADTGDPIGDLQATAGGGYVAMRAANGSWAWQRSIAAPSCGMGGLTVDEEGGHIFVSGHTWANSISFNGEAHSMDGDMFVASLDMNGAFEWMARATTTCNYSPQELVPDGQGGVYVEGWINPAEGQVNFGPHVFSTTGFNDVYLAHIAAGGSWDWVNYMQGSPEVASRRMVLDSLARPVLVGCFNGLTMAIGQDTLYADPSGEMVPPVTLFVACFNTTGVVEWAVTADSSVAGYSNLMVAMAPEEAPLRVFGGADPDVIIGSDTIEEGGYFVAGLDYDGQWLYLNELDIVGGIFSAAQLPDNMILVSGGCMTPGSIGPLDVQLGGAMQIGWAGICDEAGHWYHAEQIFGTNIAEMYVAATPGQWRAMAYGYFNQQIWLGDDTLDQAADGVNGYICDLTFTTDGFSEYQDPVSLSVWPVPAREVLNFAVAGAPGAWHLRVVDTSGRTLIERNTVERELDLRALPSGCYVLQVEGFARRFVKQ